MTDTNAVIRPDVNDAVQDKYCDLMTPGYVAEFSPDEADLAGAFEDDALNARDAYESAFDAE
ncbi:conjugal transfer protein TraD [Salmonella enterica subsp. enterica serovar Typhimurium]|nr:conjugal transfer protein TraD [Salmonella enterica]EBZ4655476.1 conjugal transfer protein TraD [Salmonella enterica subsp. enterica serovar Sandiego]EDA9875830.1 conjugal transfer protein TraD [Salmonella enterica subsp. enterica serovar Rubislaw]EHB0654482.1 conjugal transfer protein TraD [Salmonella enterica subsp. enterica serovar Typhimurium]EIK9947108.1 conjugal transfer protein TraD [Escherichia coli]